MFRLLTVAIHQAATHVATAISRNLQLVLPVKYISVFTAYICMSFCINATAALSLGH